MLPEWSWTYTSKGICVTYVFGRSVANPGQLAGGQLAGGQLAGGQLAGGTIGRVTFWGVGQLAGDFLKVVLILF